MNANVHNKTTSVNKRLNGGRGKKKKETCCGMSVSQRGNPKNIRATVKALVREKTFPYAAGLCWCKQPASRCYQSTHYIYTQTHSYHISQNRARERERGGEREMQSEENNSIGRQHAAPASGWFVRKQADAPKLDSLHSCLLFDSSFKVGSAASWGLHACVNKNPAQSTSSHILVVNPESMWTCAHLVHTCQRFVFLFKSSLTWCKRKLLSSHWPNECIHMQTGCFWLFLFYTLWSTLWSFI